MKSWQPDKEVIDSLLLVAGGDPSIGKRWDRVSTAIIQCLHYLVFHSNFQICRDYSVKLKSILLALRHYVRSYKAD